MPDDPKPWIRPSDVTDVVAQWTGFTPKELCNADAHGHPRRLNAARRLLIHALRDLGFSLKEISDWTGMVSPASVSHHLRQEINQAELIIIVQYAKDLRGSA